MMALSALRVCLYFRALADSVISQALLLPIQNSSCSELAEQLGHRLEFRFCFCWYLHATQLLHKGKQSKPTAPSLPTPGGKCFVSLLPLPVWHHLPSSVFIYQTFAVSAAHRRPRNQVKFLWLTEIGRAHV